MTITCELTPAQLDTQSHVQVHKWLDMNSEECKDKDNNPAFTKKCLRIGMEEGFLFTDLQGRIWGKGDDGSFYPFHFEYCKKLYGFRLAAKAAN
jgi:hypothetical protein